MIDRLIAEATECDFKVALETKKSKSWLKSISAFANCIGGTLFFGVDDNGNVVGLDNIKEDADNISRLIRDRITPLPEFVLSPKEYKNKQFLVLIVSSGSQTPYYYKADGKMEAFIRMGNESISAPDYVVNELILKGSHRSFDSVITETPKSDYSFTLLEATYRERAGIRFETSDYISFGLASKDGMLTNAGKLLTDQHSVYNARLFCTRWNGLEKGSIFDDALDDKEYEGSLIHLLQSGMNFVKNNSKVRFEKKGQYRVDKPDYSERAVTEALVNALIHRDYLIMGSEVHIDMFDDRLEIVSPGGMYAGKTIQECNINEIDSVRRNPIIADLFHRMKYMERRGSGLKKILAETKKMTGYSDELEPTFTSTVSSFMVTLKNVNGDTTQDTGQVTGQDRGQVTGQDEKIKLLLNYCSEPRTRLEMQNIVEISSREYFNNTYLKPLLESGKLILTIPDKPTSRNQKYVTNLIK